MFLASTVSSPACDRAAYYIVMGDFARALQQLDGVRSKGTSSAANENLRGVALMLSGDAKKAVGVFDAVIASDPTMLEARFNRAVALLKLGEPAKASAEFEKIALDEHNMLRATAAYHNALALDRLSRPADALTWSDRALALDNTFDAAFLLSGTLNERSGHIESAARSYLAYLRRHPDSTVAMLRLGVCAQRANRLDVAVPYLKRVVVLAPDSSEAAEARKFLIMWE
ncbi:MAG TPA: tetratricopeptide repeat protein [Thermoanaerobaculia bacterium]|nr:tetratricopeptide repeat protein [Thermoanaerobaculia bacterium]